MSTPEFPTEPPAAIPSPLAPWGTRAAGYIIDFAPIWILQLVLLGNRTFLTLSGLVGIAYFVYMGYLDGVSGQTPGKAIMGIRLVDAQGNSIGNGAGIGRKFVHILDAICFIGFLLPIVDAQRQTFADKIMTTYVVTGVEKKPFSVDLWMPPDSAQPG